MKSLRLIAILLLAILLSQESFAALTQKEFNEALKTVSTIYRPIVKQAGGNLSITGSWNSNVINAAAEREASTKNWSILTFGGLARLPQMTRDGFVIVLCHELGHHLGGYPKKKMSKNDEWSSAEGQADYFATLKCSRKIFADDDNEAIVKNLNAPEFLTESCRKSFANDQEMNICIRSAMAGKNLIETMEKYRSKILGEEAALLSFETISPTIVRGIDESHPRNSCRLNILLQASLCDKDVNEALSDKNDTNGICSKSNGDVLGLRPSCWYNPKQN